MAYHRKEVTYHSGLRELGLFYVLNFLISVSPMGFLTTWVYVKNNRSMLVCIIFHLFVNTMQEKIAMTPQTKCVETIVITLAAVKTRRLSAGERPDIQAAHCVDVRAGPRADGR